MFTPNKYFFSVVTVQSIYFQSDILKTTANKYSTSMMFLKVKCWFFKLWFYLILASLLVSSFPEPCINLKIVFSFGSHILNWEKKTNDVSIFSKMKRCLIYYIFHLLMLLPHYTWCSKKLSWFCQQTLKKKQELMLLSLQKYRTEELKYNSVQSCLGKWYYKFAKASWSPR